MRIAFTGSGDTNRRKMIKILNEVLLDRMQPHQLLISPEAFISSQMGSNEEIELFHELYMTEQFSTLSSDLWQQRQAGYSFIAEHSLIDYAVRFNDDWVSSVKASHQVKQLCNKYQAIIWENLMQHPYDYCFYVMPDAVSPDERDSWKGHNKTNSKIKNYILELEYAGCETKFFALGGKLEDQIKDIQHALFDPDEKKWVCYTTPAA